MGLVARGHPEIEVPFGDPSLAEEAEAFARGLLAYVVGRDVKLEPQETFAYGYWLTSFRRSKKGVLEVWEYNHGASGWVLRVPEILAPPFPEILALVS